MIVSNRFIHFILFVFFSFSRHVRINWHTIQTVMISRGMFGFSFWHNFCTAVKSRLFFVLSENEQILLHVGISSAKRKRVYFVFFLAGAAPLFTLGVTFIDENVSKKMSSVYLGEYRLCLVSFSYCHFYIELLFIKLFQPWRAKRIVCLSIFTLFTFPFFFLLMRKHTACNNRCHLLLYLFAHEIMAHSRRFFFGNENHLILYGCVPPATM